MTDLELLSNRLRMLENRFHKIKLIGVLAGIVVVALLLMGQRPPRPTQVPLTINPVDEPGTLSNGTPARQPVVENEVRAHQIILVDDKGKERASLVADNAGSVFLVMSDTKGKSRVNLSVSNDGPTLTFFDPSGKARTIVGSTTAVPSHVNDNGVAELAPPSSVVLFDSKGKLLFRAP